MAKSYPNHLLIEAAAWAGTALIIISYALLSLDLLPGILPYHIFNLLGSAAIAAISYKRRVWQPFVVNVCFALFALIGIIRIII